MPFDRLAGQALNILPDRMNLFLRYMGGVGNEGLELDDSTLRSLRQATERVPTVVTEVDLSDVPFEARGTLKEGEPIFKHTPGMGPGVPASGPSGGYNNADRTANQTLGRFMADVKDDGSVRITDTYDMENEFEDPDLVSGKFQPGLALTQLQSIYDPSARMELARRSGGPRPPMDDRNYGQQLKDSAKSHTSSPLTKAARAAMYLLPIKPKPFDIDITIPPTTR